MSRQVALAALAMEAQVALRDQRLAFAPVYPALSDADIVREAKRLAELLRAAERQARRLAGFADGMGTGAAA